MASIGPMPKVSWQPSTLTSSSEPTPPLWPRRRPRDPRPPKPWRKGAIAFRRLIRLVQPALVNGAAGVILAPRGRLLMGLWFAFHGGKIAFVEVIAGCGSSERRLRAVGRACRFGDP